jgi:hypothetical protein
MATALLPGPDGPVALTEFLDDELWTAVSGLVDERDWMELLANTTAGRATACAGADCCGGSDLPGVDGVSAGDDDGGTGLPGGAADLLGAVGDDAAGLLDDVVPVSITGFMDADAADAGRLENCCISVPTPDGDLVPFCGYNMTTEDGDYALRSREGWGGRPAVDEPVPAESTPGGYTGDRRGGVETRNRDVGAGTDDHSIARQDGGDCCGGRDE